MSRAAVPYAILNETRPVSPFRSAACDPGSAPHLVHPLSSRLRDLARVFETAALFRQTSLRAQRFDPAAIRARLSAWHTSWITACDLPLNDHGDTVMKTLARAFATLLGGAALALSAHASASETKIAY